MSEPDPEVEAGQSVYNRFVLGLYDVVVLNISARLIWQCPKATMLENYQRHVGATHLELGVGTAYFPDRVTFPVPEPAITLVDLNEATLQVGARRLARYQPSVQRADVLQPLALEPGVFDSVALNFLLHCLPGDWDRKGAVFASAGSALRPGGVVFGSTILSQGVPVTAAARRLMAIYNAKGIFHNTTDDLVGLRELLALHFREYDVTVRGCVAIFSAGDPIR
jgi:SAM-dependent methyltransferase